MGQPERGSEASFRTRKDGSLRREDAALGELLGAEGAREAAEAGEGDEEDDEEGDGGVGTPG